MFDAHCHLGKQNVEAFLCTSRPAEYPEAISRGAAIGLLPPFSDDEEALFFKTLEENPNLAIGEIGLDKRFGNPEKQEAFLTKALSYAKAENRFVTLHIVGYNDRLFRILRKTAPRTMLWHSFTGSYETAKRFLDMGGVISLSEMSFRSKDIGRVLTLPFFLETDLPEGEVERKRLEIIYEKAARLKGIPLKMLVEMIENERTILKT